MARRAVLPSPAIGSVLAEQLQRDFARWQALAADAERSRQSLAALLPLTPAKHLLSIPGTSVPLVARYVAGVGDPEDYLLADQIWAKVGLDPLITASGDTRIVGHISRQGDPFLQDTLYQLGYQLALHCGYFSHTFLTAIARGKSPVEVTLHTAHQVNRVCFHLWLRDEPFNPPHIPNYPEFEQLWQTKMRDYLKTRQRKRRAVPGPDDQPC